MKRIYFIICAIFAQGLIAQQNSTNTNNVGLFSKAAKEIRMKEGSNAPSFVRFSEESEISEEDLFTLLKSELNMDPLYSFQEQNTFTDAQGIEHRRYKQYYNNYEVAYSNLMLHLNGTRVVSFNGSFQLDQPSSPSITFTEERALRAALNFVNANQYRWELEGLQDPTQSVDYPKGKLMFLPDYFNDAKKLQLTYRFNVYATVPLSRQHIFVDAASGEIVFHESLIHTGGDSHGRAVTAYSDTQNIVSDSINGAFSLADSTRGNGIETYDCMTTRSYPNASLFIDSDNFWDNVNASLDQYAGDAHWGTEATYDYFFNIHNRNSIDDSGFTLRSYIHYDVNYVNAFWDGQRMTYGDGNQMNLPLTTLDIVGHEITHGLTDFTSDLIYANESGALNESFSDIFGAAIEFYARPNRANWTIGEDIGGAFRNMMNPKANGDPDTYDGQNWIDQNCIPTANNDRCGVHTNSGVQNRWFYILAQGASGVNDMSDTFNVNGIGMLKAEKIAFRNLTVYLSPSSNFADARFFSILSAIDLYGACSPEVEATTNAWYAVGVGDEYVNGVSASFSAVQDTAFCFLPVTIDFMNEGNNVRNFHWDFGNGDTSNLRSPSITYTTAGQYTVQLIADGLSCGVDTITKVNYIRVDSTIACSSILADGTNPVITDCSGRLYDSGGFGGDYSIDEDGIVTIHVASSDYIELDFKKLAVEAGVGFSCNRDYVEVFDGATVNDPIIGRYCSNYLPVGNKVNSSSNYVTLLFHSDEAVTDEGFQINWECKSSLAAPTVDFVASTDTSCSGLVEFDNLSTGGYANATWYFGDGTSDTTIHARHEYYTNGTYDVRLVVSNAIQSDSITKTAIVTINRPASPTVSNDTFCIGTNVGFKVNTTGNVDWYRDTLANQIFTGDSLTVFNLRTDTALYVRESSNPTTFSGGPLRNASMGMFSGDNDYIEFDVYKPIILKTLILFSNKARTRTLDLWDNNGKLVKSQEVYVPASPLRVNINMEIPAGTDYKISFSDRDISLFKDTAGASFPYQISNLVTLKGANNPGEYPYFYQWRVAELPCVSNYTRIEAKIDTTCSPVGVNELKALERAITMSPNPFKNKLTLNFNSASFDQQFSIKILSLSGQVIQEKQYSGLSNQSIELNLSTLSQGVYYINIVDQEHSFSKKVIKIE